MSRHRNFQNLSLADEDDRNWEEDDYYDDGVSYEDQCLSPTSSQYIFTRHTLHQTHQPSPLAQQPVNASSDNHANENSSLHKARDDDDYLDEDDGMFDMDDYDAPVVQTKPKPQKQTGAPAPGKGTQKAGAANKQKGSQAGTKTKNKHGNAACASASLQTPTKNFEKLKLSEDVKEATSSHDAHSSTKEMSSPPVKTPKIRNRPRPEGAKTALNLIVIGHVDSGKSTLMGHLLLLLGNVDQRQMHKHKTESEKAGKGSFAFAWVLDESAEERARGVTMDIGKTRFQTEKKSVILLDAPGHKDFIPNMISGATQADAALLVANATTGEFETGFDLGGQTREHTMLVRSLGVNQLAVVVNQLDKTNWSETRFNEVRQMLQPFLKQTGFPKAEFVPASGYQGVNLKDPPPGDHPLAKWYKGRTLAQVIDCFDDPVRNTEKPLRLCISNVYKGVTGNLTVEGKVETGSVEAGDRVVVMPNGTTAQVKMVQGEEGLSSEIAYAGDQSLVSLTGVSDPDTISPGHVMCHSDSPVSVSDKFLARLVVLDVSAPLTPGVPVAVHSQSVCEAAWVGRLEAQIDKNTGEVVKRKPRCLPKHSSGLAEIRVQKPLCLETYANFKELGRVTLRSAGKTVAVGLVEKLL